MAELFVHPTVDRSDHATIGMDAGIWHLAPVRKGARIGLEYMLSNNVYSDFDVIGGSRVKTQNTASVFHGVTNDDGICIGPHGCLRSDRLPRATNPDGCLKGQDSWEAMRFVFLKEPPSA